MKEKRKVLMFVQDGVGGAERMTALIGRYLDREKFDICFCLIRGHSKSSITDFIPTEIRKIYVGNNNILQLMFGMVFTLIKEKPNIIFSSVFNLSNKLLLMRWVLPHAKFIIRCDNYLYTYNDKQRRLLKKLYPQADIVIAQTEEMGQELTEQFKMREEKIKVLHNPIDKELIDSKIAGMTSPYPDNGKKHYVAVGRFDPQKGFDLLIDAFIAVRQQRNDVDLYFVGDTSTNNGIVAKMVRQKAEDADVSDSIVFCGYQNNPYHYIRFADCFVLSSRWEGLPNVLIESLYLGTPVAAFKCIPIIERIVNDGKDGCLAEKENVESLTKAMLNTLLLGRVKSTYKSSSIEEFIDLF